MATVFVWVYKTGKCNATNFPLCVKTHTPPLQCAEELSDLLANTIYHAAECDPSILLTPQECNHKYLKERVRARERGHEPRRGNRGVPDVLLTPKQCNQAYIRERERGRVCAGLGVREGMHVSGRARARRVCAGVFVSRMQPRANVCRSKLAKLNSKKNKERKDNLRNSI